MIAILLLSLVSQAPDCLYGTFQEMDFPDYYVREVYSFPDMYVQLVKAFPDQCGEWQPATSFPDFTVKFVTGFEDFTVQFVDELPPDSPGDDDTWLGDDDAEADDDDNDSDYITPEDDDTGTYKDEPSGPTLGCGD